MKLEEDKVNDTTMRSEPTMTPTVAPVNGRISQRDPGSPATLGAYIEHPLPVRELGVVRTVVSPDGEVAAFIWGNPVDGSLVRIQSRCTYGEVLGSEMCECRGQLDEAVRRIACEGHGIILYLDQEGRGAGLAVKARAYRDYDEEGLDTFSSYENMGLNPDLRCYEGAAAMLLYLGVTRVRLLTNNPDKTSQLRACGITVEQTDLIVSASTHASAYLAAKRARGHLL